MFETYITWEIAKCGIYMNFKISRLGINYSMVCPLVHGENPRALANRLSPVQVANHGITFLCNSYTMGCPPVRGDNPRALAS